MDSYKTVARCILIFLHLQDIQSLCDVDHCDLEYCSGAGCLKCKDGYYLLGTICNNCPSSCTKCTGDTVCTECKRGWYGATCNSECRRECSECEQFSQCTECIPGRYGSFCQLYCPLGCIDIQCNKESGKCTEGCKHGYYQNGEDCIQCPNRCTRCSDSDHCSGCISGYFGSYCQSSCPQTCRNERCDKILGHCTDGCIEGYYVKGDNCDNCPELCASCIDFSTCTACKTGYWGLQCENECPIDCVRCDGRGYCIEDPTCNMNNCARGYCSGDSCIKCEDGCYLTDDSCHHCPAYCTQCSGPADCTQCVRGKYGTSCEGICRNTCSDCTDLFDCTECIPGRYGPFCQFYCPLGCIDIVCNKESGKCTEGCRHGYYHSGEDCNPCPEHCTRCCDDSNCTDCVAGYFGTYCETTCPSSCKDKLCDKEEGYCTAGCSEGYFEDGLSCSSCPSRCTSCLEKTTCNECISGYWGPVCQFECPLECTKCTIEGECIFDSDCTVSNCEPDYCTGSSCIKCETGYYLSEQSCNQCPLDCADCLGPSTCTDCVSGRYGAQCETTCRDACLDCDSSSKCTECIPGRFGQYCQLYCPLGCIDIVCNKDTGKCLEGCRHGYYLNGDDCSRCPENCARCSDRHHCTTCLSGYYGTSCASTCPSNCKNQVCNKSLGVCTEGCTDGYFLDGNNCVSCPVQCESCADLSVCIECKTGYWGLQCEHDCPGSCLRCANDGQCINDPVCLINNCERGYCYDRSCIKCEEGYYLSGTHCLACPPFCKSCEGPSTCTECARGRYGQKCEYTCITVCTDCISASQCTECIPGRYGPFCQNYCSLGCNDILCEKETGKCTKGCRKGYYSSQDDCVQCPEHCAVCTDSAHCTSCSAGYHGQICQNNCPSSCVDYICDKRFGNCTEGCIDGYYPGDNNCFSCPEVCEDCISANTCTECIPGLWGPQCQQKCPAKCSLCTIEGVCIEDGGTVCHIDNCEKDFCFGSGCIKCEDGYYLSGTHCHQCDLYCTKCSGDSLCSECVRGRYGTQCEYMCSYLCPECTSSTQCTECIPGRHGATCELSCPLGCKNILCDKDTGRCIDGCRRGYYSDGENCVPCPPHCSDCSDSSYCSVCYPGYFGDNCQTTCSQGCEEQSCHKDTGYCTEGCKQGYYFDEDCLSCPDTCVSCVDGTDCDECKPGYWGSLCHNHCSVECYKCFKNTGQCIDDSGPNCYIDHCDGEYCYGSGCTRCKDGYYLYETSCNQCPHDCETCSSVSMCNKCKKGKYGTTCEYTCENTCVDCVSATECTDCMRGRYGSMCQLYCPLGCQDIICDKTSGKCTEGCRNGYYLSGENCVQCPVECITCSNDSHCTECSSGFYGSVCERFCHKGCLDHMCHIDTGNCSLGCSVDYHFHRGYCVEDDISIDCQVMHCDIENCFGHVCTLCEEGYYLAEFTCYECPHHCISCSVSQCEECSAGRHGPFCQFQCSPGCRGSTCSKDSGFCTEGCEEGYIMSGGDCKLCPINCISCTSFEVCTKCKTGFWGTACENNCLSCDGDGCQQEINCTRGCQDDYYVQIVGDQYECIQCPEGCSICTNSSICSMCKAGYWGSNCNERCNPNCKEQVCTRDNGYCVEGCEKGYYGNTCAKQCSSTCESCQNEHTCTSCTIGKYGTVCENICSNHCFRNACLRDNGTCLYGCSARYYGSECDKETDFGACRQNAESVNGAAIGLGIILALAGVVIAVLVFILLREREQPGGEQTPAIMNQTYDTRIGTADLYSPVKRRGDSYDNSHINSPPDEDKQSDTKHSTYHYPSSDKKSFDENYDEEAEYSIIRTSNDNVAS